MYVCISTKNRNHFYAWTRTMVSRQSLSAKVVIVDGSETPSIWSSWEGAFYVHRPNIVLGASRNLAMATAREHGAEYIAIWDDDDYYEPWHLEKAVRLLSTHGNAMAVGSTLTPLYFQKYKEMWSCGPYHDAHAIEPSLVFRAELARTHQFDPADSRGLGAVFLKDYTVPLLQMPGTHIIIAHGVNTVSKDVIRLVPSRYCATKTHCNIPSEFDQYPVQV